MVSCPLSFNTTVLTNFIWTTQFSNTRQKHFHQLLFVLVDTAEEGAAPAPKMKNQNVPFLKLLF